LRRRDELRADGLWGGTGPTPLGRRVARGMVWPFSRRTAQTACRRIRERVEAGDCRDDGLVPETLIAGHPWGLEEDAEPLGELQAVMLPLLAEQLVESRCTVEGHCYYALGDGATDTAIRAALPSDGTKFDAGLSALYLASRDRERQTILRDRDRHQNLGEIPLALCEPVESGRDYDDLAGIRPLFPNRSKGD